MSALSLTISVCNIYFTSESVLLFFCNSVLFLAQPDTSAAGKLGPQ